MKLRKGPKTTATSVRRARKIVIDFPEPLFSLTEKAVSTLATNRSEFIRRAVEEYLRGMQRQELEQELAEGYQANAQLLRSTNDDFAHVDGDLA